ncbi:cyclin G [Planococcus citri]|uniref:cyclin G n=1 Tax=Planococcus citri TaxID=170843 RepID=UPI0031F88D92
MDYGNGSQPQPEILAALLRQLQELLNLQRKFQPNLMLPTEDNGSEVTLGIRDGSAHILRCLKIWYELPSDVLFAAINIMDRFLTKMKVQPKYIACISIASFHIACKLVCSPDLIPDPAHLISISQCKCTLSDLSRMTSVIISKVEINFDERDSIPITSLTFLRLLHQMMSVSKYSDVYKQAVDEFQMFQRLEVLACDGSCVNFECSYIALALLCSQIDIGVARLQPAPCAHIDVLSLLAFVRELQQYCQIVENNFYRCLSSVLKVISQYNSQSGIPHRQRLVWRLSQRALRHLRPTDRLKPTLPTIKEQSQYRIDEE